MLLAMPGRSALSVDEVVARAARLPEWRVEDNKLRRTFTFDGFTAAFGWMTRVAIEAERINHHPNWTNVWNRVEVELWTHDAGGLTPLDFQLAASMNAHAAGSGLVET